MFRFTENTKKNLYETFGRTEKMVEDDVNIITTWMKSQPHLPEIMEDVKIKNFLNLCKFSVEKTKGKIDMYYTIRSLIPELFEKSNPKSSSVKRFFNLMYTLTLPKLLEETHRVYILKVKQSNIFDPTAFLNVWFAIFEVRLYEDFMVDDIIIIDMDDFTFDDFTKVTPTFVTNFFNVYKKVYSLRMKKLLYINCPSFVNLLAALLKAVIKPKLFERIEFHKDDAVLKKMFSNDVLPKDYGGEGPSLDQLNENMQKKLEEYQERFDKLDTLKVNENLRPEKLDNDEILGFYGSFKKIDLD